MYILGFSGPPHCGKSTIAATLAETLDTSRVFTADPYVISLVQPLWEIMAGLTDYDVDEPSDYARFKANHHPLFEMQTGRQVMIDMSENFFKAHYGQDFWARLMFEQYQSEVDNPETLFLVENIGFQAEVNHFIHRIGEDNVSIVQIQREGCTFEGDSRSYIGADKNNRAIENNSTPEWAAQELIAHMENIGWTLR